MIDDEFDELKIAYYRKFNDFPIYPRSDLSKEEAIRLLRQALITGTKIYVPPPEPGSRMDLSLKYVMRFGAIPYFSMPDPSSPEFDEKLKKALETGIPIKEGAGLPPDAVL